MSRRRALALALGAVVVGALCLLLGGALLGGERQLQATDAALAVPGLRAPSGHPEGLGATVAERLLGTSGDWRARAAAADWLRAQRPAPLGVTVREDARLQTELTTLAASGRADRRSWAGTLLGVLDAQQAKLDPKSTRAHLAAALDAFRAAAAVDARNEDAKYDLELLLTLEHAQRQQQRQHHRRQQQQHRGQSHARRRRSRPTAGLSSTGSGW